MIFKNVVNSDVFVELTPIAARSRRQAWEVSRNSNIGLYQFNIQFNSVFFFSCPSCIDTYFSSHGKSIFCCEFPLGYFFLRLLRAPRVYGCTIKIRICLRSTVRYPYTHVDYFSFEHEPFLSVFSS